METKKKGQECYFQTKCIQGRKHTEKQEGACLNIIDKIKEITSPFLNWQTAQFNVPWLMTLKFSYQPLEAQYTRNMYKLDNLE